MQNTLKRVTGMVVQTGAISLIAATVIGSNLAPVAADPANMKEMFFNAQSHLNQIVRVISTDGKKWDKIKPGTVTFGGHLKADTKWPGYITGAEVSVGYCTTGYSCNLTASPIHFYGGVHRDYEYSGNLQVKTEQLMKAPVAGNVTSSYGQHIIDSCNQGLQMEGPVEEHSFYKKIATTFGVSTGKSVNINNGELASTVTIHADHVRGAEFTVKVVCEPKKLAPIVFGELAPLKIDYLKVFLSTYSHTFSQPKAGVQCKKGRALMRVKTNRIGPVKLKLTTRLGDGPLKSDTFEVFAKLNSEGVPQAEVKKWFSTTESTVLKARLSTVSPEGSHTNWEELPLNCSSSGGGGWAQPDAPDDGVPDPVADNTGNEGTPAVSAPVKGELSLMDSSKTGSGLARKGTAFMLITSTEPAAQAYRLKCNTGFDRIGQTKPKKVGVGQYAYARQHVFPVTKTEFVKCVLRWQSPTKSIVLDTAERTYQVLNPGSRPAGKPTVGNMAQQSLPLKLKTKVELQDPQAAGLFKKRMGRAVIKATSNKDGKVKYKLRCGKGRQWSGEITPKKKAGLPEYVYNKVHVFPVKKTQTVKCIMRVRTGKGMPERATTQRAYEVDAGAKAHPAGQAQ